MPKTLNATNTLSELVEELNHRLTEGHYRDSVHKIKLLTTKETVVRLLEESEAH